MRWGTSARTYQEKLRHTLQQLKRVKTWQLVVVLLLSLIISATLLRLNNLAMLERREAVLTADEQGDSEVLKSELSELQRYVTHHMNTSLNGGFYLSASYERAREAAMQAAQDTSNPNSQIYQQAALECQSQSGRYVQCVLDKVSALGGTGNLVSELELPRPELYKVDFMSPLWSLDAAGISVAFCAIILLLILFRITGVIVLRLLLKRHYSDI